MIFNGKPINPGELRTPITLQIGALLSDAGTARKMSWSNFATNPTAYCKWKNSHGPESADLAKKSIQRATVLIRYRDDVNMSTAVLNGTDRWQVTSIDNIENRNEYLELQVELVKGAA